MLLIVGKHTDRLQYVHRVASRAQVTLRVANNDAALSSALGSSRRSVVLLAEEDVGIETGRMLQSCGEEPNLVVLIVMSGDKASPTSEERLAGVANLTWLAQDVQEEKLVELVTGYKASMFRVSGQDIGDGIRNHEFIVRYQPKVEWCEEHASWRTTEAEALVRWQHPEYGLLAPRHFLPEASQFGFMAELSEFVLRNTLSQINAWSQRGLTLNGCVNLAPELLDCKTLTESYRRIAAEFALACERINFEVPTAAVLESSRNRAATLDALRAAGFKVSLDDFGSTGNCVQAFEKLNFDEIKIHASLIRSAQTDLTARQSLAALTGMAHQLGIAVCAEGVETDEMFALLQQIHCNKMQGYLVSEAVMPEIIRSYYSSDSSELQPGFAHLM